MKKKLSSLFGKFESEDLCYDVYRSFMHHYKVKGLDSVVAVSKFFESLKKVDVENKKILEGPVELPVKSFFDFIAGSRVFHEKLMENGTLRELMPRVFICLDKDKVKVQLGRGDNIILEKTGFLGELTFSTEDIVKHNFAPGTLLVLKIQLLEPDQRREELERRCFFGAYDKALEKVKEDDVHKKVLEAIEDKELLNKRLSLYGVTSIEDVKGQDFASTDLLKIIKILEQMRNPYISNEALKAIEPTREREELSKMKQWLTRSLGDSDS